MDVKGKTIHFCYGEDASKVPQDAKEVRVFIDSTGKIYLVGQEDKSIDVQIKSMIDNMDMSEIDTYAEICAAVGKKIG